MSLRRREFMAALGAASVLPLAARAQQRALPMIGYLSSRTAESDVSMLVAVRPGLGDVGYAEGRNLAIEYRFADGRYDRLSAELTVTHQSKCRSKGKVSLAKSPGWIRHAVQESSTFSCCVRDGGKRWVQ
jgi:hypothetical protein